MSAPLLDARDRAALIADIQALAPFYTPQWRMGTSGPSRAVAEVFAQLQRETITRLNRVPDKYFLDYLDRLGIELLPARAARAPVVFTLAKGATLEAVVPANARVAAGTTIFESESSLAVTPAQLKAVYSVVPQADLILDHASVVGATAPARFFDLAGTNVQEHALYLADGELFNVKSAAVLVITVNASSPSLLRGTGVKWEWWGKDEATATEGWHALTVGGCGGTLRLTKVAGEIAETALFGVKGCWIRCRLSQPLGDGDALAFLELRSLSVAAEPPAIPPDAAIANDIPLKLPPAASNPLLPFGERPRQGDTFYIAGNEALSKPGARVVLNINGSADAVMTEPVESVHGIGRNFQERLRAAGIDTVGELLRAEPAAIAAAIRNQARNLPASRYLTRAGRIKDAAQRRYYDTARATAAGAVGSSATGGPRLSWEYWNGNGWVVLSDAVDSTNQLQSAGTLTFTCPSDVQPFKVGGQEHRWIRVRIAGGDYGQEKFVFTSNTWTVDTSDIHPPQLSALTWSYSALGKPVKTALTRNNLSTASITTLPVRPFVPLADEAPGVYLGLDRPLVNGPYNVLATLTEFDYAEDQRPRLAWEYGQEDGAWSRLTVDDGTQGLIRTGIVSVLGPSDAVLSARFGQSLFWVRALDVERRFNKPLSTNSVTAPDVSDAVPIGTRPCAEDVVAFQTLFPFANYSAIPAPIVAGLYLNAAWVRQTETLTGERFGASEGTANQSFRLSRTSVMAATIWVNELGSLSEEEIAQLPASDLLEERDLAGNRTALWVRWDRTADLTTAAVDTRVYALDSVQGVVTFGDGSHGRVPPIGHDNLKADYRVGGGVAGNVAAKAIKELKTGVARIDKLFNPIAAEGGADTETTDGVIARGPHVTRHRHRAVTARDYEDLAREAAREVGRVRCLPHTDDHGQRQPGWVTLLIAPVSTQAQPQPRPSLKETVRDYVAARAPHMVAGRKRLVVTGPVYLLLAVTVEVYPVSLAAAAQVEADTYSRLTAFLHSLTGGTDGAGWEFGEAPCLSDIIAVVQGIAGVDRLGDVRVRVTGPDGASATLSAENQTRINPSPYCLVASGEHNVRLVMG